MASSSSIERRVLTINECCCMHGRGLWVLHGTTTTVKITWTERCAGVALVTLEKRYSRFEHVLFSSP